VKAKTTLAGLWLIASTLLAQEGKHQTVPLSGDDIGQILELRTRKEMISFEKPKFVTLRVEMSGQHYDSSLKEPTTSVTLMTYVPSEGGAIRPLQVWLTAANGDSIHSYFSVDTSKTNFSKSEMVDGLYSHGSEHKRSEDTNLPSAGPRF
jgi:hypothetical protein